MAGNDKLKEKVGRYLTEMKELPANDVEEKKEVKVNEGLPKNKVQQQQTENERTIKTTNERKEKRSVRDNMINRVDNKVINKEVKNLSSLEAEDSKPYSTKDIVIGAVNIIALLLLVVLLIKLPQKAEEVRMLKTEIVKNETSVTLEFPDIEESNEKARELESLFVGDSGIVEFVRQVEEIRQKQGVIERLTITSQKPVRDKTGNLGIPILIELRGSWSDFNRVLPEIQKLPFLFRAIDVEVERTSEEGENIITFSYGVFLYVNDRLVQD
jgi:hypothetical protein